MTQTTLMTLTASPAAAAAMTRWTTMTSTAGAAATTHEHPRVAWLRPVQTLGEQLGGGRACPFSSD